MNRNILRALERNELIPVIGNDLSIIRILKTDFKDLDLLIETMDSLTDEGEHIKININNYLAFLIWNYFEPDKVPPSPYTLNNVEQVLVASNSTTPDDIKSEIIDITSKLTDDQIVLEPFRKLARIFNSRPILSVNFDNFLERAFEAEGRHLNPSVNFSAQDTSDSGKMIKKDQALATIFNLMGNIQDSDFAITEEMHLEHVYYLLMGKDDKTKTLFEEIKNKSFLLIGCSFPNWFMRFFIRTITKKRFRQGKSKFVASDRTAHDVDLSAFLENNKTRVIPIGSILMGRNGEETYANTVEFIDEMYELASVSGAVEVESEPKYKEKIFLSYSWDDKSIVTELKNEFVRNGVDLFFDDDDLRNGEDFGDAISKYIMTCDYVLPIISKNSLKSKESYVYKEEWLHAISVEKMRIYSKDFKEGQENYIRPFIIDDTSPLNEDIPAVIRTRNIDTIAPKDGFGSMVRAFIKENLTEIKPNND